MQMEENNVSSSNLPT